nr:histidine kinase [Methylobacterium brachythecii]
MRDASAPAECEFQAGCYGVQVLVAGRRKLWRDEVSAEIRRAGYNATSVDSGVDALTVLALGLPMDVLVTDAELLGELRCSRLAIEARALRPNLAIVFASDREDVVDCVPHALIVSPDAADGALAGTVREALQTRA